MHVHSRLTILALGVALTALAACTEEDPIGPRVIPAGSADITTDIVANRTLFAETTYTIKGFIHVANGATLTIMPGTTILGDFTTLGSSLFVLRGARIVAAGTATEPIVFTSSRTAGSRQPGDWGGLIIIGNGQINRSVTTGVELEGSGTLAAGTADSLGKNYKIFYSGGSTNTDNSGELRYVRVEFGGFAPTANAELNSFTFAAVGSGTKLSYLEALAGLDDSFEWFGGAVDADHLVSYEAGDDHFDMSEGYVGRLQFLIGLQTSQLTPRAGAIGALSSDPQGIENDGCNGAGCATDTFNSTPLTVPLVANFTLVGTGSTSTSGTGGGYGLHLRRGTGGYYVNGVLARWPRAGMRVEHAETYSRAGSTQAPAVATTDLLVSNVVLLETGTSFHGISPVVANHFQFDATANALANDGSATTAAAFAAFATTVTPTTSETAFDWTPSSTSPAATGGMATFAGKIATKATGASASGHTYTGTAYMGAAAPGGAKWWLGWTRYAQN
jgi:hypothetical protein